MSLIYTSKTIKKTQRILGNKSFQVTAHQDLKTNK